MKNLILAITFIFNIQALISQNDFSKTEKYFDGFYLGIIAGSQNVFGGSFVDGKDVLAQESRFVIEIPIGYRLQFFKNKLVGGAELSFGITDGDLMHNDPTVPLNIKYKNNSQFSYGLIVGYVFGKQKNWTTFIYANETKRKFNVLIKDANYTFNQTDKQGMLRYGLGLEAQVFRGLHVLIKAGRLSVDFGDLETNIDVEDKYDFMAGAIYQF